MTEIQFSFSIIPVVLPVTVLLSIASALAGGLVTQSLMKTRNLNSLVISWQMRNSNLILGHSIWLNFPAYFRSEIRDLNILIPNLNLKNREKFAT